MAFPNAFHGNIGPPFGGNFPPGQMNVPPFNFRDVYDGFGPRFEDHLRNHPFYRDADIRAHLEFRDRMEPLPPGIDSILHSGLFLDRERERERELNLRDMRGNIERDYGRERDRRRSDYDRDRGRDWSEERDGSRSGRHRDRSSNRGRSPLQSGARDTDSETKPSKYHDKDFDRLEDSDRNSSSSLERFRSRDSESHSESVRSGDDKGGDKWVCNQPSRTIILRGLHTDIDEKIIGAELTLCGLPVRDIRLIRRASGVSRCFAFVEFHNVADAKRWMELTQGYLLLLNQYRVHMDYSVIRGRGNRDNQQRNDWICSKCLGHNFKRRDYCYNCDLPRKESEKGRTYDGLDEIGTNPCNTLILRGLDALTTEEALVTALAQAFSPSSLVPVKNIIVVRDDLGTSRGFGFVEFHSVSASTLVLESLSKLDPPLEVDGKQLLINYAKNTFNTTMAYIQQKTSQFSDPGTQQLYDYSQYYSQSSANAAVGAAISTGIKGENTTNAAAAVAQAAIQQAQAVKNLQNKLLKKGPSPPRNETVMVGGVEYPVYPPPDTSTYQYEETSGFYYDPLTQLYYDASSQYYYNSTSGQYMYWDAERSTYLPAPEGVGSKDDSQGSQSRKDSKEDKKDKDKVKIAKKIAKDMEKWAKNLNVLKEAQKDQTKKSLPGSQAGSAGVSRQESATADAGFAILQKTKEDMTMMPPPPPKLDRPAAASNKSGLVASYGGDSDSGEEEDNSAVLDESKLVDWTKLACLLCKRQFQSKDILSKHTQVSDLHKQNLEALIRSRGLSTVEKIEYRDRAKERRQKYGVPEPPEPPKRKDKDFEPPVPDVYEEPVKLSIGGDNIGSKLLQKMGWSQGQGLGKSNQGRTDPVEAHRRNQMAGLGARGANVVADVGDNYRVALKKTMFARYNEVD